MLDGKYISNLRISPTSPSTGASLILLPRNKEYSELEFLHLLITDTFLQEHLLPAINAPSHVHTSGRPRSARYHQPVDEMTWWRWFAEYLMQHLEATGHFKKAKVRDEVNWQPTIGEHRFHAISSMHALEVRTLEQILNVMRELVMPMVELGSLTVVNEAIYEYTGEDARG
jgi:hypothetical protein